MQELYKKFSERLQELQDLSAFSNRATALLEVLQHVKRHLTLSVISQPVQGHAVPTLAWRIAGSKWWVSDQPKAVWQAVELPTGAYVGKPLSPMDYTEEAVLEIFAAMVGGFSGDKPAVIAPPGFFIFQWRSQWAAGGEEGPWSWHTHLVAVKRFEDALRRLVEMLFVDKDNVFDFISVAMPDTQHWQLLKPRITSFPVLRSSVGQGFNLAQAHKQEA